MFDGDSVSSIKLTERFIWRRVRLGLQRTELRGLTLDRKFVFSIDYHQGGTMAREEMDT